MCECAFIVSVLLFRRIIVDYDGKENIIFISCASTLFRCVMCLTSLTDFLNDRMVSIRWSCRNSYFNDRAPDTNSKISN